MDEQKLQFRVGLFVLASLAVTAVLIVRFGDVKKYWQESYALAIQFDEAPGIAPGTPVRMNGILIGRTRKVLLDDAEPGVLVVVDIEADRKLRTDSAPMIIRSVFGDATIEFSPGSSTDYIPPNMKLQGKAPQDPLETVRRMEIQVTETLEAFRTTSDEWKTVGSNVNALMETERGHLSEVIEKTAVALDDFAKTMHSAQAMLAETRQLVADPEMQAHLKATIATLPELVQETRQTIAAARLSVEQAGLSLNKVNANLDQVQAATAPLAEHSQRLVARLDGGLLQLESLLTELNTFATMINDEDGTLQRFATDPQLYENLNKSTAAMAVLTQNLEPTLRDIRIFADKVARHPEVLGVSGAITGSSGLKEAVEAARPVGAPR
ncbi:MAG: MCE family protein [Planctomycetaceae bacterium]|nr:MCE family protein [Planctomycetaceae bacterium]